MDPACNETHRTDIRLNRIFRKERKGWMTSEPTELENMINPIAVLFFRTFMRWPLLESQSGTCATSLSLFSRTPFTPLRPEMIERLRLSPVAITMVKRITFLFMVQHALCSGKSGSLETEPISFPASEYW